ncbi:MAG: LPS export ABC transporter permease LptG [Mesorhizobium sp.]|nr:LPS export ABC transporter permease LptG [Mesorhizobium sp.]MBL8579368.1 LPS export ABC transporter permease LptG [Mesorhizobium sp.]
MMGWTLNRYFLGRYLTIAAWYFVGIYALIMLIDFTEFSSRTVGLPGYSIRLAFAVSALRVPIIMQQAVPFVALVAAITTLVSLNRKSELVIARAAGISAWQFLLPCCIGALLFGLFTVGVLNPLAAHAVSRSETLENNFRQGRAGATSGDAAPWLRQKTGNTDTIIGARTVLNQGLELADVTMFSLDSDGNIYERRDAARAFLRDGYWELQDVRSIRAGEQLPPVDTDRVATNLRPEFVQERLARPETIPFYELPSKIEVAQSFGLKASAFATQFHTLMALPFLLVAMTLIAATTSMRFQRMGQSATMILGGVLAGFLLYVVSVLVKAFGNAGLVPPFVVAWIPVVVAMFFGVTFLLYKEDG